MKRQIKPHHTEENTDEIIEITKPVGGSTITYSHYQMPVAYLEKDTVGLSGTIAGLNTSFYPAYDVEIGDSHIWSLVYFADSVDVNQFEWNQEIRFSAKAFNETAVEFTEHGWKFYDAVPID